MRSTLIPRELFKYLPEKEKDLVQNFFYTYATAEYQLKACGFIRRGTEDAQADWDAYASTVHQRFNARRASNIARAWKTLTSNPPRKQVIRAGRLAWKKTEKPAHISDAAWGLLLVRRVRNNLFHGGKFILDHGDQFTRDSDLVEAALAILAFALQLMPRERHAS